MSKKETIIEHYVSFLEDAHATIEISSGYALRRN